MEEFEAYVKSIKEKKKVFLQSITKKLEIDQTNATPLREAISRVCRLSKVYCDETVEVVIRMNLDPRKMNENIRGNVVLPHGTGKRYVVAAFVTHELREEAKAAGADIIGDDELLKAIDSGVKPTFQVCIATPDQMRKLVLVGKHLGPLGLMPNPKMGTLTDDPIKAIRETKRGPVMVKLNEAGDIMATLGKVSFGEEKIFQNLTSLIQQLRDDLKPEGAKEQYFLKAFLKTTQSRSFQLLIDDKEPWVNESKLNALQI